MRRTLQPVALTLAAVLAAAAPLAAADAPPATTDPVLIEKCNFCHSSKRILKLDPAKVRETVERMVALNPDWFADMKSDHVVKVIETVLNDPSAAAQREAWFDAVARGELLYGDAKFGSTGKSCASCHPGKALARIEDAFPRWDVKLKRFVSFEETIRMMARDKVGAEIPPNDQRLFDLIAYIKSL